jgi:hypothetical protein
VLRYVSAIDTIVPSRFTWFAGAYFLGVGSWRKKKKSTLLLPLLTTTNISGGAVECRALSWLATGVSDPNPHCCWECALVSLGDKKGGMGWDESLQHPPRPQWPPTSKHHPQYELFLLRLARVDLGHCREIYCIPMATSPA